MASGKLKTAFFQKTREHVAHTETERATHHNLPKSKLELANSASPAYGGGKEDCAKFR